FAGAVEDPGLAAAMCRAYNRWLADYCTPYPERLFGVAMLPMQSVDLAIDEMRYAREKLGMRGGFLRPNPYHGKKMISDPMYEPFWMMAEELDFSIGFHEGSTNAMPTVGVDRFEEDRAARHMVSHTMEMMLVALSVIWGGVVDRHPRLRVAFLESGGGSIAPWLDRMDRHFDDQGFNESAPFTSGDGETSVPSYLATPDRGGPYPVVLVLRGMAGPDDGYTEIARRLAEWGYVALVHGWKVRGADPADGPVYADLQGAMTYLGSVGQADLGRLAVFGFCRGGVHAVMAARAHPEIRVIVVFHGFAFRPAGAQPGAEPYDLAVGVNVPMLVLHVTYVERAIVAD